MTVSSDQPQQLLDLSVEIFGVTIFFFDTDVIPFIFALDFYSIEEKCAEFLEAMSRLHKAGDLALRCRDPIALEAHSMLFLLAKDLEVHEYDCLHNAKVELETSPDELEEIRASWCERVTSDVARARERHHDRLEVLAAKLFTKSLSSGAQMRKVPLTNRVQAVYELIVEYGPITGRELIDKLDRSADDSVGSIDQSALTKGIIPELKRLRNVLNRPGAGYYDSMIYDPDEAIRK